MTDKSQQVKRSGGKSVNIILRYPTDLLFNNSIQLQSCSILYPSLMKCIQCAFVLYDFFHISCKQRVSKEFHGKLILKVALVVSHFR